MTIQIIPVATVKNNRKDLSDDNWGDVISEIILADDIPPESLNGLEDFSHIEIIFQFNKVEETQIVYHCHPRGNSNWPDTGIFAQHKKERPNRLGITIANLISVRGNTVTVRNLDAIDGTPVIDIKPVFTEFLPQGIIAQPDWSRELMKEYWK